MYSPRGLWPCCVRLLSVGSIVLLAWAVASPPAATATTAPQVRLTVSVPQSSYPREALVRVTVTLKNISRRPIILGAAPAVQCQRVGPSAMVLSEQGTQVYPGAPNGGLASSCGPYSIADPRVFPVLMPGHATTRHPYVILGGPMIQAVATYYLKSGESYTEYHAVSKPLTVGLYDAPKPSLTLTTSPPLSATILPPAGTSPSAMRVVYRWLCPDDQGARGTGPITRWERVAPDAAGAYKLQPDCSDPFQWNVAAGFPDQPVVYIDYCRPSQWGC